MARPFSKKADSSTPDRKIQRESHLRENEHKVMTDRRQAHILRTLMIETSGAVRRLKSQESNNTQNFPVIIHLNFWKKNDAFLLHDYRGLTPTETDKAVGIDIAFFHSELAKIASKNDEWEFTVGFVNKNSLIPCQILVLKKQKN